MLCKNCSKEIVWDEKFSVYIHPDLGDVWCGLKATPIFGHINRHLDAATILAEMEARRPTPAPSKPREPNPNYVEGTFVGEL